MQSYPAKHLGVVMGHGPGKRQRQILDLVNEHGDAGVLISDPRLTHAQRSSLLRAAKALEAAGKVKVVAVNIDGNARIVAYAPNAVTPQDQVITGLDGKQYRRPLT